MTKDLTIDWDARNQWPFVLIELGRNVCMQDFSDPKSWFEALQDFYDWASCALDTDYMNILTEIDKLLYSREDARGVVYTQRERADRKEQAYMMLRKTFRDIHKELWLKRCYVPLGEVKDPGKAILEMGV